MTRPPRLRLLILLIALGFLTATAGAHGTGELRLDQGRRWVVIPSMLVHLEAAELALASEPATSVAAHRRIGQKLDQSLKKLIASCTMTGPAHDQLHLWLVPFLQDAQGYLEESNPDQLEPRRRNLQRDFATFHRYFGATPEVSH